MTEQRFSAFEWSRQDGILILDPDGWRDPDVVYGIKSLAAPITRQEYDERIANSTIGPARPLPKR